MDVAIKLLYDDSEAPTFGSPDAAGADLYAYIPLGEVVVHQGEVVGVGTGVAIRVPHFHVGLICPRSGLAVKHGVTVLNGPGVLDEDFLGEVKVILVNQGQSDYAVRNGDRIAQLVIVPVARPIFYSVSDLGATVRGAGGFGSTGT